MTLTERIAYLILGAVLYLGLRGMLDHILKTIDEEIKKRKK